MEHVRRLLQGQVVFASHRDIVDTEEAKADVVVRRC